MLILGPTQSGKTSSLVLPALLSWEGPVLAASVKDDLVRGSVGWRERQGPVAVLDPSGAPVRLAGRYDPTAGSLDAQLARRRAARLCADPDVLGGNDAHFWGQLAAKQLAPLLLAANRIDGGISRVEQWVDERAWSEPARVLEHSSELEALRWLDASLDRDERQRSSVSATLEAILSPFSGEVLGEPIDLDDLLSSSGSLYLCAPAHDQRRLRPMFSAVTDELIEKAFHRARIEGGRLKSPLLIILDEAAAIAPLDELDVLAATCASHGITLVTCFQDLAQIEARWGARAPTVVNNHTTRVLLSGLADRSARPTLEALVGSAPRRRGKTEAEDLRPLIEADELRRLPRFRGVVISGRTAPIRLALRPWWRLAPLRARGAAGEARYASVDDSASGGRGHRRHLDQGHPPRRRVPSSAFATDAASGGARRGDRKGLRPLVRARSGLTGRRGIPRTP